MAIDTSAPAANSAPDTASSARNPAGSPAAGLSARDKLVLFVLCAAQFMVALDFSVLNVALPVLGADLGMSDVALQWAVTAFALPSGGFLLLSGRLGDLYGRRRLFLSGLALFAAASVLATFAWDPASFLTARALQGIAAAAIVPTGMALLTTTFSEGPARDRALALSGTLMSLGFTVGMVLGGILTDTLGWRSTMGLLAVFALIVLPLAPALLTESRSPERPRLDVPGAITVTGGLLALIYALTTAAEHGFGTLDVQLTLAAGVLLLAAFVRVEARAAQPLVSLPMLRRPSVAWGNLGGLITFSMMTTIVFVLTLHLQDTLGLSPFETGVVFGVQGVAAAVSGSLVPRFVGRLGARRVLVAGLAGQAVFTAALLVTGTGTLGVVLATAVASLACFFHMGAIIGYGITVTSGVPDEEQGLATGLVTSSQQLGLTVGIPLLGVLATTAGDLTSGYRMVVGIDALIVLAAALLVAAGLRRRAAGPAKSVVG
ncbi:MFS transporter [Streptomyces indicus]|uniref:Major Facilitator Superfamily protein n=1 Tax=Streptomyces indicus TaxID=417292 RepID=A0A1G9DBP3_9ACTN|nr:MFS transporter [Streptomyces indicus]SDK61302.1 Major Facilitator Superfamily protein [Streptomyces indicus]